MALTALCANAAPVMGLERGGPDTVAPQEATAADATTTRDRGKGRGGDPAISTLDLDWNLAGHAEEVTPGHGGDFAGPSAAAGTGEQFRRDLRLGGGYRVTYGLHREQGPLGPVDLTFRADYGPVSGGAIGCALVSLPDSAAQVDAIGPCGASPERSGRAIRFHQRTGLRSARGVVTARRDLGDASALTLSAGLLRTRRRHDEAYGLLAARAFERGAPPSAMATDPALAGAFGGAPVPRDTAAATATGVLAAFSDKESVASIQATMDIPVGGIAVVPGLRYEHTRQRIGGFSSEDGVAGTPVLLRRTYGTLLPSLAIGIAPSADTLLQARWSRDLGRPDLITLSPGAIVESRSRQVWLGNPALRPYRTDSLGITGLWRPDGRSALSVRLFARIVDDPVVALSETRADAVFAARHYDRLTLTRAVNGRSGQVAGIEARYRRRLDFLPGPLDALLLDLSAGRTRSRLRLGQGRTTRFPFQPAAYYSAALAWRRGAVDASFSWTGTGTALLTLGSGGDGAIRQGALRRLDASAGIALGRSLHLVVAARNLTDEAPRHRQDGMQGWANEAERYGRTLSAALSARF